MGNWHFFIRDANYDHVFLSFYLGHNDVPPGRNITFEAPVELKIPIDIWRELIQSWEKSEWGTNRSLDNMSRDGKLILDAFNNIKK